MTVPKESTILPWLGNILISAITWVLAALGVGALLAGGVVLLVAYRLDEEVRHRAEQRLAAGYPGLKVVVGSARVVADRGIELRGIQVYEPNAAGPRAELLHVDEIFVECPTSMAELMADPLPVSRVILRRPAASATLRADGTWSLARLFPPPCSGGPPPPVVVENGTVRVFDPQRQPASMYVVREINVRIDPINPAGSATGVRVAGAPHDDPCQHPDLHLTGVAGGDHLQRIDLEGIFSAATASWIVKGRASSVQLGPELREALPGVASEPLAHFGELRGRTDVDFTLENSLEPDQPVRFSAVAELSGGHLADPQLPVALTDIGARLEVDNRGWRIPRFTARQDAATLTLAARHDGFAEGSPTVVQLSAHQLRFDYRLVEALPPAVRSLWDEFRPSGVVDVQATMTHDGRDWRGDLTVDCIETGFVYQGLPYPIRSGIGNVTLKDNQLAINLRAFAGPQPVTIQGRIASPGANWHGWLDVRTAGPVPIDARVLAALPVGVRPIVESFEPHGGMTVAGRLTRAPGGPVERAATLNVVGGDMRYARFPYPLRDLAGRIELAGGIWSFRDFSATNGVAKVTCNGHWSPGPEGGRLELAFDAANVPLEHDLRSALPESAQQAWAALGPQGSLDRVVVKLVHEPGMATPSIEVHGTKLPPEQRPPTATPLAADDRGLALVPIVAPYRFEQVTGTARYRNGVIELEDLRGTHGTTVVMLTGGAAMLPDGRPRLVLTRFAAERVALDRDLILCLPEAWRANLARVAAEGQFTVRGAAELIGPADWNLHTPATALAAAQARWDLGLELSDVGLELGVPLSQIRGKVQLAGGMAQGQWMTRGELALASLNCRDVPLTEVAGPFYVDQQVATLGAWASRGDLSQLPRRASGRLFGGVVSLDAQASLAGDGGFQVRSSFSDGSLAAMCQEMLPGATKLRGRVFAGLELAGNRRSADTLRGRGSFKLRDADLYELPVVLSTLKLLRSRTPDKTAFHAAEGEFDVAGSELVFRDLRLEGDAVTLKGQGTVGLNREVDLTFHSVVGRNDILAPLLSPLLGEASRQILEIHLTGTLDRPDLDSQAFPAIKESLDRLFPELARRDKREPVPANPWNGIWKR